MLLRWEMSMQHCHLYLVLSKVWRHLVFKNPASVVILNSYSYSKTVISIDTGPILGDCIPFLRRIHISHFYDFLADIVSIALGHGWSRSDLQYEGGAHLNIAFRNQQKVTLCDWLKWVILFGKCSWFKSYSVHSSLHVCRGRCLLYWWRNSILNWISVMPVL